MEKSFYIIEACLILFFFSFLSISCEIMSLTTPDAAWQKEGVDPGIQKYGLVIHDHIGNTSKC